MIKNKVYFGLIALSILFTTVFTVVGQVDLPRRTTAITYPLNERVTVQFRGTTRFPRMGGKANIRRTARNGTEIDLSVSKMPRPFELGAGYATYILWAISPEGQVDNLGEIKRRGFFEFDSSIKVTTRLQTFSLLITAEPHFLVKQPSQEIMLENLNGVARNGQALQTTQAVQYFGNSSDYFRDSRTPEIAEIDYSKTPSTVLQARQAVALARFAGAERDAPEDLREAETLLTNADQAWQAGRREADVDITARQAIGSAVKAEATAYTRRQAREVRNEQSRNDAEMRQVENNLADANRTIDDLRKQLADETRNRELSQRDVENNVNVIRDLRNENSRLTAELTKVRLESQNAKDELIAYQNREQEARENQLRQEKLREIESGEAALMQSLKKFGTVTKNDRGLVLTLSENFWSAPRAANFAPTSDTRLSEIGSILGQNNHYRITIESHTDDSGNQQELESLTQQRSSVIAQRLAAYGINSDRIDAKGLGATIPVAPNNTNANRARNRRVQLIMIPVI